MARGAEALVVLRLALLLPPVQLRVVHVLDALDRRGITTAAAKGALDHPVVLVLCRQIDARDAFSFHRRICLAAIASVSRRRGSAPARGGGDCGSGCCGAACSPNAAAAAAIAAPLAGGAASRSTMSRRRPGATALGRSGSGSGSGSGWRRHRRHRTGRQRSTGCRPRAARRRDAACSRAGSASRPAARGIARRRHQLKVKQLLLVEARPASPGRNTHCAPCGSHRHSQPPPFVFTPVPFWLRDITVISRYATLTAPRAPRRLSPRSTLRLSWRPR